MTPTSDPNLVTTSFALASSAKVREAFERTRREPYWQGATRYPPRRPLDGRYAFGVLTRPEHRDAIRAIVLEVDPTAEEIVE